MEVSVGAAQEVDMSGSGQTGVTADGVGPFWWCLTHEQVEPTEGCPNTVRMGPYPTYDDASRAIERAHERTRAWEADDA